MATTTPNLSLYLPGGGSTGTYTPDEVADIDRLNQNFVNVDDWAGIVGNRANRAFTIRGVASARTSVTGMQAGDRYQETSGGRYLWVWDGANWLFDVPAETVCIPTGVRGTGTSIQGTQLVFAASGNAAADGVFDGRFSNYRIDFHVSSKSAVGSISLRFATAGNNNANANYDSARMYNSGTTPTAVQAAGGTGIELAGGSLAAASWVLSGTLWVNSPAGNSKTTVQGQTFANVGGSVVVTSIAGQFNANQAFDGANLIISSGGGTMDGRLRVVGLN